MKSLVGLMAGVLLFRLFIVPAQAAFTSLYAFGDGVCTTTNGPGGPYFYGKRWTNGRVWLEVLAERQGISYESNKNWSYFGHDSTNLVQNVNTFTAPPDASNALFVIWCIDADLVWNANNSGTNLATWTNAMNQALTNYFKAITNLYAKGARTLITPTAVDITKVPYYAPYAAAKRAFIRQRAMDFNAGFAPMLSNLMTSLPGLTIHVPNIFTLFDNMLAQPASYGVTNVLDSYGLSIDALADPALTDKSVNGPGTNYFFWDNLDPSAKVHAVIGDFVQQLISPPQINKITVIGGSNRLDVANVPVGRDGWVIGSTNLVDWTIVEDFDSTNVTQSIFVTPSGPMRFYRLSFPSFTWSWP